MCGIVGYVGRSEAAPILLDGLRRLEYRGYDSAGVAIVDGDKVETRKCAGRIVELGKLMAERPPTGTYGISHTRWATHGKPTDQNAHPHFDATGRLALVHNGVIENYQALKDQLIRDGDTNFSSDTDTEVLAHLIGKLYDAAMAVDPGPNGKTKAELPNKKGKLVEAVRTALRQVIGTYGIALVHRDIPDFIVGARRGSPLVLGVGKDENEAKRAGSPGVSVFDVTRSGSPSGKTPMRGDATDTDSYLADWRRADPVPVGDDLAAEVEKIKAEIEATYDKDKLKTLIANGGKA